MRGRSGLVYSLQWFEQFAENVLSGPQFCGLVYEGQSVEMCKVLLDGGVDVLDASAYWRLPNGETKCCSGRALRKGRSRMGFQPDSKDEYEAIGAVLGF